MTYKHKRIGISGGTFDPIHHGHLIMAETIRQTFDLDKVIFIPSGSPPHKDGSRVSDSAHRYSMVELGVVSNPCFEASRIELDRPGKTYTIDTLSELARVLGEDSQLFFIIGADIIPDLVTWRQFEKVFTMCEFIAVIRPGFDSTEFINGIEYLKNTYMAKIHITEAPLIGISSTMIRSNVSEGRSIRYLVPECVEAYIMEKGLYCAR